MYNTYKIITVIVLAISGIVLKFYTSQSKEDLQEIVINIPKLPYQEIVDLGTITIKAPKKETSFECLRKNIYLEAGNQGVEGMIAVANVTMNRVKDPSYPKNVCDVVYQAIYKDGKLVRNKCQFSWYCDGKTDNVRVNKYTRDTWKLAGEIAQLALKDKVDNLVGDATHYHADYVNPYWSENLQHVATVGNHIFYQ